MPKICIFIVFLLIILPSHARNKSFVDEFDTRGIAPDIKKSAPKDSDIKLPDYPENINLLEFFVDSPNVQFRHFIDMTSLYVSDVNQTVYYTLIMQSNSGARNVSFEAIRCDTNEYKTYAVGTGDSQFRLLAHTKWVKINNAGYYKHHQDLRALYFCHATLHKNYSASEILSRLKLGNASQRSTSDFF